MTERKLILPQIIFLQPWCEDCDRQCYRGEGRMWCEDQVFDHCEECGAPTVKYAIASEQPPRLTESDEP